MDIDVVLAPAEVGFLPSRDLRGITCVIFDVLRATSTMITAFANGVTAIQPVATVDEALKAKQAQPDVLLGGERHGDRIPGFDLGNSPLEYLNLPGRRVITTTTNGTVALRACAGAAETLAGALLNLDAIASRLRATNPERVLLVCAGTFRDPALEDVFAAGALIAALGGRPFRAGGEASEEHVRLSDAAQTALSVHAQAMGDDLGVLQRSRNGRALIAKGRANEVEWCARRSVYPTVGVLRDGWVRSAE